MNLSMQKCAHSSVSQGYNTVLQEILIISLALNVDPFSHRRINTTGILKADDVHEVKHRVAGDLADRTYVQMSGDAYCLGYWNRGSAEMRPIAHELLKGQQRQARLGAPVRYYAPWNGNRPALCLSARCRKSSLVC